jgi:hypothetical protein
MEMHLLVSYSLGWALKFGVPGRRWLIIPLAFQGFIMATAWLVASPIVRHPKPPVFKPWFIGRCQAYMSGKDPRVLPPGEYW